MRGWFRSVRRAIVAGSGFDQAHGVKIAAIGLCVLLTAALAGVLAVLNTDQRVSYETRALQVRAGAIGIGTLLARADADVRTWLLVGEPGARERVSAARNSLEGTIQALVPLLAGDEQRRQLQEIAASARIRLDRGEEAIARAAAGDRDAALQALAGSGEGHEFERRLDAFVEANLTALHGFGADYKASTRRLLLVIMSASLAILFFGLHQLSSSYRFVRDLAVTRRRLRDSNLALEATIDARTAELTGALARFEVALRAANVVVFTQDRNRRFTFVSRELFGIEPAALVGRTEEECFPAHVCALAVPMKEAVLKSGSPRDYDYGVVVRGEARWFRVRAEPLRGAGDCVEGIIGAVIDVTEEMQAQRRLWSVTDELQATIERFQLALRSADVTVFAQDADLRYTWASSTLFGIEVERLLGEDDAAVMPGDLARRLGDVKRDALESGEQRSAELRAEGPAGDRWFLVIVEPRKGERGSDGLLGSVLDITERRAREGHNRILLRELTHRTKNLLAVVQAIARQTLTTTTSAGDFEERFSGRLQGLAASLDILFDEDWHGASLSDLIRSQLSHYREYVGWRIRFDGPDLRLEPEAAQNLGLALHELCSNASRFGALSGDTGRVDVSWEVTSGEGEPLFRFRWKESGGPPVRPPARKGFGTAVLERLVPRSVSGKGRLDHEPSGLVWTFEMPGHLVSGPTEPGTPLKIWGG